MADTSIRVCVRFRPQNARETAEGGSVCVEAKSDSAIVITTTEGGTRPPTEKDFNFDRVFMMDSDQVSVFDYVARPVLDDCFKGFNGTIFAYGQTGSGKTHTMMGTGIDDEDGKGIIPRVMFTLFDSISQAPETMDFEVSVNYVEIYMEKVKDLIDTSKNNLSIREDPKRGIYIQDVTDTFVGSPQAAFEVMRMGDRNRVVAFTQMNAGSSRSHSIFTLNLQVTDNVKGCVSSSKLNLVDLAGSEKIAKTGAEGQQLEEAKKINQSLSALGNVINALTSGSSHIPYRDSKLTRILQESLGGNAKTTLIVCCSCSSWNDFETVSSLRFGMRAKNIKNKVEANTELSREQLKKIIKELEIKIKHYEEYIAYLEGGGKPNMELKEAGIPGKETTNSVSIDTPSSVQQSEVFGNDYVHTLQDKVIELETALQASNSQVELFKALNEDMTNDLQSNKKNNELLESQVQELKKQNGDFDNIRFSLEMTQKELTSQKELYDAVINEHEEETNELITEIDRLRGELTQKRIEIRNLQGGNLSAKDSSNDNVMMQQLEEERKRHEETVEKLNVEISTLKSEIADMQKLLSTSLKNDVGLSPIPEGQLMQGTPLQGRSVDLSRETQSALMAHTPTNNTPVSQSTTPAETVEYDNQHIIESTVVEKKQDLPVKPLKMEHISKVTTSPLARVEELNSDMQQDVPINSEVADTYESVTTTPNQDDIVARLAEEANQHKAQILELIDEKKELSRKLAESKLQMSKFVTDMTTNMSDIKKENDYLKKLLNENGVAYKSNGVLVKPKVIKQKDAPSRKVADLQEKLTSLDSQFSDLRKKYELAVGRNSELVCKFNEEKKKNDNEVSRKNRQLAQFEVLQTHYKNRIGDLDNYISELKAQIESLRNSLNESNKNSVIGNSRIIHGGGKGTDVTQLSKSPLTPLCVSTIRAQAEPTPNGAKSASARSFLSKDKVTHSDAQQPVSATDTRQRRKSFSRMRRVLSAGTE